MSCIEKNELTLHHLLESNRQKSKQFLVFRLPVKPKPVFPLQ